MWHCENAGNSKSACKGIGSLCGTTRNWIDPISWGNIQGAKANTVIAAIADVGM